MENEESPDKKDVYFVKKRYEAYAKDCANAERNIERRLLTKFNLIPAWNLDESLLAKIESDKTEGTDPYALITHVPPTQAESQHRKFEDTRSFYTRLYKQSIEILWAIKKANPLMPIIAYTGADNLAVVQYVFQQLGPINDIVFKSRPEEWEKDAIELENRINKRNFNFAPITMPWGEVVR
jgi:hypothetical protein